jgi:glycerophosphoryl diester phosphodiesterase
MSIAILIYTILILIIGFLLIYLVEEYFYEIALPVSAFLVLFIQIGLFVGVTLTTSLTIFYIILQMKIPNRERNVIDLDRLESISKKQYKKTKNVFSLFLSMFIIVSLIFLFVINLFYFSEEINVQTMSIAHRGDVANAIENSIESLNLANSAGTDYVEMDIFETKDQKFVVIHDINLKRLTSIHSKVYEKDLNELVGTPIYSNGFNSKISSFDDYIDFADEINQKLLIEIKIHGHEKSDFLEIFTSKYGERIITKRHMIHTLDFNVVEKLKSLMPELKVGYILPLTIGKLPDSSADFFVVEETFVSHKLIKDANQIEKEIFVWTINDEKLMMRFILKGVNGIITDDIYLLKEVIKDERDESYLERAGKVLMLDLD